MDPLTQTALGALAAQVCARGGRQGRAALAGGLGGLLPDADVFLRSAEDSLQFLEYHRHFTHSLAFIPVGALVVAGLAGLLAGRRLSWRELYLPALIGVATHGLLDACTSYGTRLWWPVADTRVAWNLIAIIDPLFTVPLLVGVVLGLRGQRGRRLCLALALAYLGLCALQHQRALGAQAELAASRGHLPVRATAKPSLLTNILFRSIYEVDGHYHVDAVRVPWLGAPRVYEGTRVPVLDQPGFEQRFPLDELQRRDVERFRHFSDGFLIEDPRHPGVIGDLRYATLPDTVAPLWGVDVRGVLPGQHLAYRTFRALDPPERSRLFDLLLGRSP